MSLWQQSHHALAAALGAALHSTASGNVPQLAPQLEVNSVPSRHHECLRPGAVAAAEELRTAWPSIVLAETGSELHPQCGRQQMGPPLPPSSLVCIHHGCARNRCHSPWQGCLTPCRAHAGQPLAALRTSSAPCPVLQIAPLSDSGDPSCMQGTHQPPLPPSSAALVHRQAISLPPASPQAQLPEQLQLQLLPSADERQTLAMPFGGHGRPTTPELSAAMGQLTSLVAWDQVLSLSGNPLEGLVQMVNNYAQVRRATLCRQGLLAVGQQVAKYAGQPDAVRSRYLHS